MALRYAAHSPHPRPTRSPHPPPSAATESVGTAQLAAKSGQVITAGTSQEEIASLLSSGDEVTIQAGDYAGKKLAVSNGTTLIVDGTVETNDFSVNNGTVRGKTGRDTDKVEYNGSNVTISGGTTFESVSFDVTGSSANYSFWWSSGDFYLTNASLNVCGTGNSALFIGDSAGSLKATDSDLNFSNNSKKNASGIWVDWLKNDVEFVVHGGSFKMNDNGGNGFRKDNPNQDTNVHFVFDQGCQAEASGNGTNHGVLTQCDGFSYAKVTVSGEGTVLNVSNNDNNGLSAGGTGGSYTGALDVLDGASVIANNNGRYGIVVRTFNAGQEASNISDASVTAKGNGSDGIYYQVDTVWENATVIANGNSGSGVRCVGDLTVSGSSVEISNNTCTAYSNQAGLYLGGDGLVDETNTKFEIRGNTGTQFSSYHRGGGVFLASGASLDMEVGVITDNAVANYTTSTGEVRYGGMGGGVFLSSGATFTAVEGVQIWNNDAGTKGDDIYCPAGATIDLVRARDMGEGLILTNDGDDDSSNDQAVTTWMYDGANPTYDTENGVFGAEGTTHRWERDVYAKICYVLLPDIVSEEVALKAAYGPTSTIAPIDLTIYKGGTGYENVAGTEDGSTTNGFPKPGYYITLPDNINADMPGGAGTYVDLSATEGVSFSYTYNDGAAENPTNRTWTIGHYAGGTSRIEGGYVYTLTGEGDAETLNPTLFIIDEAGNRTTSDDFDTSSAVYATYKTSIGTVNADVDESEDDSFITASLSYTNDEGQARDLDCQSETGEGTLTVRGVNSPDAENVVTPVATDASGLESGVPLAVVEEGATYYLNEHNGGSETLEATGANASLLFDDILAEGELGSESSERREQWLEEKAESVADETGAYEEAGIDTPSYEFKYLDLVDADNGNVYLTTDSTVTVYWPYPEGTDKNTNFVLLHYTDLHREDAADSVEQDIQNSNVEQVQIRKLDDHIEFTTTSFSPFALVWDADGNSGQTGGTNAGGGVIYGDDLPSTGDSFNLAAVAAVACAGVALVSTGLYRVRKHSK